MNGELRCAKDVSPPGIINDSSANIGTSTNYIVSHAYISECLSNSAVVVHVIYKDE